VERTYIAINATALGKPNKTGVEWYAWQLLKYLAREWKAPDPPVVLFTTNRPGTEIQNKKWRFKILPGKIFWTQYHLLKFLKRHPPALLFSPSYVAPRFLPPKIKTVNVVHGLEGERYPEFRSLKNTLGDYLINVPTLKKSFAIIAVSKHTKADLSYFYNIPSDQIKIIPSGGGTLEDDFESETKKKSGKNINLFFLAGSNDRKNLPLALRIFSNLKKIASVKISLTIAGIITEIKYRKLILADKNIHYLGYVNEKEKIEQLKSSHFLLYTSFYEGFGFPVLEAQKCGAVPIVLKGSGLKEIGGEAIVEYDPANEGKALEKIKELIKDRQKYSQMQKIGLKNSQGFSWQKCAKQTRDILITTAGNNK